MQIRPDLGTIIRAIGRGMGIRIMSVIEIDSGIIRTIGSGSVSSEKHRRHRQILKIPVGTRTSLGLRGLRERPDGRRPAVATKQFD
jgi:hypothetical protein